MDRRAEVAPTAEIGAYAVIDGPVTIEDGARIYWHASVCGRTHIGRDCQIHPYTMIGHAPQDLAYEGADTECFIGAETVLREGVTVHRGTAEGTSTLVGKRCFLMAYCHVGHNCEIGDDVKIVNAALLAGHVKVGNAAFISGMAGIHQFVRIGDLAMIGGQARIRMDVPPFFTAVHFGECSGLNSVGVRRAGFSTQERNEIRHAYRLIYRSGLTFAKAIEQLAGEVQTDPGRKLVTFLQAPSKRGICSARQRYANGVEDSHAVAH